VHAIVPRHSWRAFTRTVLHCTAVVGTVAQNGGKMRWGGGGGPAGKGRGGAGEVKLLRKEKRICMEE